MARMSLRFATLFIAERDPSQRGRAAGQRVWNLFSF